MIPPSKNVPNQIPGIQILRGVAALMVVFHHVTLTRDKYISGDTSDPFYGLGNFGQAGVDIFFVISGFIMMTTKWSSFGQTEGLIPFFRDRILRIVPLYWIFTTISVAISIYLPTLTSTKLSTSNVISSYLFLPIQQYPIVKVGWSLNYEILFYFIFGLFTIFPRRFFILAFPFITSIAVALGQFFYIDEESWRIGKFYTSPLFFEFFGGCIVAVIVKQKKISHPSFLSILIATVLFYLSIIHPNSTEYRALFWGIPSVFLCYGAATLKYDYIYKRNFLLKLGDASFSIYLSHPFFMPLIGRLAKIINLTGTPSTIIYSILSTLILSVIGLVFYRFVEVPINRLCSRLKKNQSLTNSKFSNIDNS